MLNDIYQSLDPVIFTIGPISLRWYGLAYICGFAFAAVLLYRIFKRWNLKIDSEGVLTIMLCVVFGVFIGARLGYCLFYGDGYYFSHPLEIFAVNKGGMSFHGGLIGALIAGAVASKLTKVPYLTLTDIGVVPASLALFFGRCANFINGELWGAPTNLPWGVVFGGSAGEIARHPSQLYEAVLEGLVIFIVLYAMTYKKPIPSRGSFTGVFLTMYGVFRFLIEFVREPDVQLGYLAGGWFTMGMALSIPLIIAGVCLIVYALKTHHVQEGMPSYA